MVRCVLSSLNGQLEVHLMAVDLSSLGSVGLYHIDCLNCRPAVYIERVSGLKNTQNKAKPSA
jgi:hypothetical protein